MAQRFRAAGLDQFSPRLFSHSPHEFAGAVGVFPEDVVDVFEGLFEHGHWEGRLRNNGKRGSASAGAEQRVRADVKHRWFVRGAKEVLAATSLLFIISH